LHDPSEPLPHLVVLDSVSNAEFHGSGGGNPKIRPVERRAHGEGLLAQARQALTANIDRRTAFSDDELQALGTFVTLEGESALFPLKVDSLEQQSLHRKRPKLPKWLLMSVQPATPDGPERAVVWVADAYRQQFLRIFQDYLDDSKRTLVIDSSGQKSHSGNPANRALVANIATIRATILRDLWQSKGEPQTQVRCWWELWLEPTDRALRDLHTFADAYSITVLERSLVLGNRLVVWVNGTWGDLELLTFTSVPLAEVR